MHLISNELADLLQYFTFPLELVGISLAYIEIRFPAIAERWSRYIVITEQKSAEDSSLTREVSPQYLFVTIFLAILASMVIMYTGEHLWVYVATGVLIIITLMYVIAARWVPNHAIGTIGLALATLGMFGELYQLIVQMAL